MVITDPKVVDEEKLHVKKALSNCGYPQWAFDKISQPKKKKSNANKDSTTPSKGQIVLLLYMKSEL